MTVWTSEALCDIADFVSDKVNISELDVENYISTENMLPDRGGVEIAAKLPASGNINAFAPEDVLFSNIRTYFKKVWMADREGGASADVIVFRPKNHRKITSRYLYYLISSDPFIAATVTASKGTKMPRGDKEAMRRYAVAYPPLPIQRRIAGILSAYDELIENNQRRIRILEDMARSLYREWFVHFRYPGHESVPQIDSPLGQIPQGWEVKKIAELLAKVSRQGKIKTQDYLQAGELPVIDQGRELVGGYTNDADVEYSGELPVIVFGDHTRILKFIDFPFACGADGTQLLRSNDERMPVSLFYYTLSAIELSDFAYARHFKFLKEELVVVPIAEVATAFSERVDPIKRQVRILQQQSGNLRRTRDLLLPRLLSGQVTLDALKAEFDEVML